MAGSISSPQTKDWATQQEELRRRVLTAGGTLGWSRDGVARFAEALTGKRWDECGPAELGEVLEEYRELLAAVRRKRERGSRGGASFPDPSHARRL